ncbi:MAG: metallophosphoesterase [Patescibacteria group bacterium]|nr:metallophosphoesterase [Patescibacteria group bacterium]
MSPKEYYFISDLHIGDKTIGRYAPTKELIAFLKELKARKNKIELIIVGDAFGFWEININESLIKLKSIIKEHQILFDYFKKTGKKIKITIIPGNHDYDLACQGGFGKLLQQYGIHLEPRRFIKRNIANKKIWIEHGSQYDDVNRIANFGDPNATPIGYYITNKIVGGAYKHALLGKQKWLKDLGSVYPSERILGWMFSNYFYREMSPILRYILLPFFLFFSFSFLILMGLTLEKTKVLPTNFFAKRFGDYFPILGDLIDAIVIIDIIVLLLSVAFIAIFAIPFFFISRDVKKAFRRYEIVGPSDLNTRKEKAYLAAGKKIFREDPSTVIFVHGHTHSASVKKIDQRVILNTGAWTKRLKKITSRFLLLPAVYYPSFQLSYFKIYQQDKKIVIDYQQIAKKINSELTFLQRFAIFGKKKKDKVSIPQRTLINL